MHVVGEHIVLGQPEPTAPGGRTLGTSSRRRARSFRRGAVRADRAGGASRLIDHPAGTVAGGVSVSWEVAARSRT
jgi:hypothetical protein